MYGLHRGLSLSYPPKALGGLKVSHPFPFTVSWTNESGWDKLHYEVELYNALGQVVAHIQAGDQHQVDIPLNRKGIFLGRVKAQGQVIGSFTHISE
ncbi:MAG: T9SS type A sorting domain-containing protein [Bacteroidetes bacterium]|nr:T9SS type A sorting domain-containing protein [Bacteroidota bacterium]